MTASMESLLDCNSAFDHEKVKLLDMAMNTLHKSSLVGGGDAVAAAATFKEAESVLTRLQQHPESWRLVQVILQYSEVDNTRLFAISLLSTAIKTRWNILPVEERDVIPKYLFELSTAIVKNGGDDNCNTLLTKVNETLVEVIKRVWPLSWTTFIEDLIASASNDPHLNYNNLSILSLFIEDVLDFGDDEIVSQTMLNLKQSLLQKFPVILNYTIIIITSGGGGSVNLKTKALECSCHCLKHTPVEYALQNDLPNQILQAAFDQYETRILCLQCLTEIYSQKARIAPGEGGTPPGGYHPPGSPAPPCLDAGLVERLATSWYDLINRCGGASMNVKQLFSSLPGNMKQFWELYYVNLSLCVLSFHRNFFATLIESRLGTGSMDKLIYDSVDIMRFLIQVPNEECFSICVEFWLMFSERLERQLNASMVEGHMVMGTNNSLFGLYQPILHEIRTCIIERMAKPPEVYVKYDEETGCAIGCKPSRVDDGDPACSLYQSLKQTLVNLTRIEPGDTEAICLDILKSYNDTIQNSRCAASSGQDQDDDHRQWNVQLLCKLCWSIGSISGILPKELPFLLTVLKSLLSFCQVKSGKQSKALIASMIMYIMGQYPKYLKQNDQLLLVVIDKNLEFMEEQFPGVQDMACETFYKVAQACCDKLSLVETASHQLPGSGCIPLSSKIPYILYLCSILPSKASRFTNSKLTVLLYSAASVIIASHPNLEYRNELLKVMMKPLNDSWSQMVPVVTTAGGADNLTLDLVRNMTSIIGINTCAASAMANTFALGQFTWIIADLLTVYEKFAAFIEQQMTIDRLNFAITKEMRAYKKAVLRLLTTVIETSDYRLPDKTPAAAACKELIECKVIPYVIEHVLMLYPEQNEALRDPEVMQLGSAIIMKKSDEQITLIMLQKVFQPSLETIRKDYIAFPEARKEFFLLVNHLIERSFNQILGFLQTFVMSLVFGIQHENPEYGLLSLKGLVIFLSQIEGSSDSLKLSFLESCYSDLMGEVINVLTDSSHQYGFHQQAQVLYRMMLFAQKSQQANVVGQWLNDFLLKAFPHLGPAHAESFALRFTQTPNEAECRRTAKDLLITIKEYAAVQ